MCFNAHSPWANEAGEPWPQDDGSDPKADFRLLLDRDLVSLPELPAD